MLLDTPLGAVVLLSFDRDARLEPHQAPGTVLIQVLEGHVVFTIDGTDHSMHGGDVLAMEPATVHAVHAVEPTRLLLTKFNLAPAV